MRPSPPYLVTGGAGFIGSHIAEALLRRGRRVRLFDNFSSGRRANLHALESIGRGHLEVISGDLRDRAVVRRAVRGVRFVLHQGAVPSVARSVRDPLTTHQVNVDGTLHLLLAARDQGVQRFVYASSSSVYGESLRLPKLETHPAQPVSPYAVSKLAGEHYCLLFHRLYDLGTVALRYFNVYGPRQDPASEYAAVVPRFITALLAGRQPVVYGDGRQSRDFTYVADVVQANLRACRAPRSACGLAYNIAGGRRTSLLELLRHISRLTGAAPRPRFEPPRAGDVRHSQAGLGRARRLLRFRPRVNLAEGLDVTVRAYARASRA
ncbi:MAG: NAD-dependent epimerase/dehydratase family protein [Chloroflexi bacterium]|nr:NAD-dependent epimerase/dehydratase family protein [Chloroflexota bacterium]